MYAQNDLKFRNAHELGKLDSDLVCRMIFVSTLGESHCKAQDLLSKADLPIAAIAVEVGFARSELHQGIPASGWCHPEALATDRS
jgi:AraC-like DNA-binding protein